MLRGSFHSMRSRAPTQKLRALRTSSQICGLTRENRPVARAIYSKSTHDILGQVRVLRRSKKPAGHRRAQRFNSRQGANFPSIKRPASWTVQSDWPLKKDAMRLHGATWLMILWHIATLDRPMPRYPPFTSLTTDWFIPPAMAGLSARRLLHAETPRSFHLPLTRNGVRYG